MIEVNSERWLSLEDLPNEQWLDIVGYEGLYKVSNFGRVKSLERKIPFKDRSGKDNERIQYSRIVRVHNNGRGYLFALLWKNGDVKREYVHRIVASAFILNPQNLPQVNHKDENKLNNQADNLEWCTSKYNNHYNNRHAKNIKARKDNGNCRVIIAYDLYGNFVKRYDCSLELEKDGFNRRNVYKVCNGKAKTHNGYIFRFKDYNK